MSRSPNPAVNGADALFIQFAKSPVVGQVKTRLLPALTAQQAMSVHIELLQWTARVLVDSGLGPVELAVAPDPAHPVFDDCLARGVSRLSVQRGDDLGERMYHAMATALAQYRRVVLVGSDCPFIDATYLSDALSALARTDVVLGAAHDGGFVLIGARVLSPAMFDAVGWGSDAVLAQTQANLARCGLSCTTLPPLHDIDRPEDLALWEARKASVSGAAPPS
jgi:rSAM/selenodomain-associated transferase 1